MPQPSAAAPPYQSRHAEHSGLYRTLQAHLESFLAQTAGDGEIEARGARLRPARVRS